MRDEPAPSDETKENSLILSNSSRRSFLKCSAWAGTGVLWALVGGIPRTFALDDAGKLAAPGALEATFHFVQISDSHIGFNKEANPEPGKTLQLAIDRIKVFPRQPSLILSAYRRYHPSLQAGGIRHGRPTPQRSAGAGAVCAG